MAFKVEKPGILSTVQDLGRFGHRRFGVGPGGAMDRTAARIANLIVGNDEGEAVLEMHFPAPELRFEKSALIAVTGAEFGAEIDGTPLAGWRPERVQAGSLLRFRRPSAGHRAYLAIAGGLGAEEWLGSRSTHLRIGRGGYEGRALRSGDRLGSEGIAAPRTPRPAFRVSPSVIPRYRPFPTVRFVAGKEFGGLTERSRLDFESGAFTVSRDSDRMGFRLDGGPLEPAGSAGMLSSAVDFGTVQLFPDGRPVVLMADHQTTGGYPRIAHILSVDLPLVAQLGPGDRIAFHRVSVAAAEAALARFERDLALLRAACRFRL